MREMGTERYPLLSAGEISGAIDAAYLIIRAYPEIRICDATKT